MKKFKRRQYKKRSPFKIKLKKQTVYTVGAIWLWIFATMITLAFFLEAEIFVRLREELLSKVGWVMYGLPPFLVTLSFLFFKVKSSLGKPNVPLGLGVLLLGSIGLFQQGTAGEILTNIIANQTTIEIAILFYIGIIVVGMMILFNASLDRVMNLVLSAVQTALDKLASVFEDTLNRKSGLRLGDKDKAFLADAKLPLKIKGSLEDKPFVKNPPPVVSGKNAGSVASVSDKKSEMKINPAKQSSAGVWDYPSVNILSDGPGSKADRGDIHHNAGVIEQTLESFGLKAKVVEVNTGPAVTQYAIKIALGTKVSKITALSSDLALALAAPTGAVRIEAPIPGRDLVGIEIPNRGLEFVTLKHMLQSDVLLKAKSKLAVALGLDVSGTPVIADIGKMPHVLIAGTTGSGKSVLVNSWITSLLFRTTPQEVRLILVDPKRVELTGYNGIPHLLTPVIVEPDKILSALKWATSEMDSRYKQFAEVGVRNIDGFNELSGFQAMPYIVIFIDELADLMAYAPVEVEDGICRLAQMARATGIHLVLATQRPSVDVITGLIKANVPSRIAFNVSSMIDSRVVLDTPGAEKLLGRGDMLYIAADVSKPSRIQGTYVSEKEVNKVVEFLKAKNTPVEYTQEVTTQSVHVGGKKGFLPSGGANGRDQLFEQAVRLVCQHDKASASLLQRRLSVGYARAARIIDQLESEGVIGPGEGAKPRDVLIKNPDDFFAQQASQAE